MYKVAIVDDEPIIVEGLCRTTDWQKYNCEVVGTADSGISGMKLVQEKNPDILFSDIRMASMDGLAMIAALKLEHPDMEITILTGYRDFDQARTAIQLGVRRYLMKPSKMDEIYEAIEAMTHELKQKEPIEKEEIKKTPAGNFIVKNAMEYMNANYAQKMQLSDVAEHVYVSPWHLSKLINSETGESFSEVLNGIRIKEAQKLMSDPSLRISDIADKVGFLDLAHFSRVFKKTVGMSANEYRNTL